MNGFINEIRLPGKNSAGGLDISLTEWNHINRYCSVIILTT